MKFSIAATAALTAVAYAAPAAVYDEDCDETVAPVYKVEAPKYEAVHPAPSYDAGKKDEHKAEAPKYEVHPAPTYGGNKGDDKCPKQECPAGDKEVVQFPIKFTSTFSIVATPEQVVNMNNTFTGGNAGAIGYYNFGLNSDLDLICYNITLVGVTGDYQSPADTATHIHDGDAGMSGPPRIAFPNPTIVPGSNVRAAYGCLTAPFVTGLTGADNVTDTGSASGFTIADIEANPAGYNADVHTTDAVPGAVRGQFGAPL